MLIAMTTAVVTVTAGVPGVASAATPPPPPPPKVGSALTPDHAPKVYRPGPSRTTAGIGGAPTKPWTPPVLGAGVAPLAPQSTAPRVASPQVVQPGAGVGAPGIGLQAFYPVELRQISDRLQLLVDTANGNVIVRYNDLVVGAKGFTADVSQVYNNISQGSGAFGRGWTMSTGADVGLEISSGKVILHGPTGYTTTFTKNSNGSYTTGSGGNATLVRNGDGTWTLTQDKSLDRWDFFSDGTLSTLENKAGSTITMTYQPGNSKLAAIYDPLGRVTTVDSYDAGNRIVSMTDSTGAGYGPFTYDAGGNLTAFPDRGGNNVGFGYDSAGNLTSIVDPNGDTYALGYDSSKRVTSIAEPNGTATATTTYAYPAAGKTTEKDPRGNTSTYFYDSSGRQTKATDPLGHDQSKTWTANSDVASTSNALGANITYGFDGKNNPVSATQPTGAKTVTGYTDPAHPTLPTSVTDPQGNQITGVYDATGNLLSTKSVQQNRTLYSYTYNGAGQPTKVTDGEGRATTYQYDQGGHLTVEIPPDPRGRRGFAYDGYEQITTVYPASGAELDYGYDAMNRLVEIGQTTATGYTPLQYNNFDANGNLVGRYFGNNGTKFVYDQRNQVIEAHHLVNGAEDYAVFYNYDDNGNLTDVYDGGGHLAYVYDEANQLFYQSGPTPDMAASYTLDNAGRRTKTVYPNNFTVATSYDSSGRQTSLTATTTGGTKLINRSYRWTNSGGADTALLQSETREGTTLSYKYNALDQLTSQNSTTYTLDKASNLTAAEGRSFSINGAGQVASSGATTYTHDGDGNLTTGSGGELANSYSVTDQLTSATSRNAGTTTLTYDSVNQSQRSAISTTNGTTTTNQVLENTAIGVTAITTNGTRSDFVRDSGGGLIGQITGTGENLYAVTDYQGSTLALVDGNQQVAAKYSYTPYGTTTPTGRASTGNPFRWIGGYQNTDNHATYNLGYRQYDPKLARFTQPDPSGQELNPYTYGLASPIINTDPSGLGACVTAALILAGVSLGAALIATALPEAALAAAIFNGVSLVSGGAGFTLAIVAFAPADIGGGCN